MEPDSPAYQQRVDVGRRMSAALDEIDDAILSCETWEEFQPLMEASLAALEERLNHLGAFQSLTNTTAQEGVRLTHADRKALLAMARHYWLKDPMCHQAVSLTTHYTMGEGGLRHASTIDDVAEEVEDFWEDEDNQVELTSLQAQERKSAELQVDGEVFLVLFRDPDNRIKVRTLPPEEIVDIICSEDDHRRPLYYKRVWRPMTYDMKTGRWKQATQDKVAFYADWHNYAPGEWGMENGVAIAEGAVFHIAVNRIGWEKRGYSEMYSYLDWAKANRQLLTDWVTIVKAYSTLAWKAKIQGDDPAQLEKIRSRIKSYLPESSEGGGHPAPAGVGGVWTSNDQVDLSPMKTSGMATDPADSRQVRLMIAAGSGIMEHYFGDAGNANLATATAMELPMLKKFGARQHLWEGIYAQVLLYALSWAVEEGRVTSLETEERVDADGRVVTRRLLAPTEGGKRKAIVVVKAPPILAADLQAVSQALSNMLVAGLVPPENLARRAMEALDLPNIDALLAVHDVEGQREKMATAVRPPPPPPGTTGGDNGGGPNGGGPRADDGSGKGNVGQGRPPARSGGGST